MTTLRNEKELCFICGETHEYTEIVSTNQFGWPDLDTRPPEMARSTITYWIRRCPSCGYCGPRLSAGFEKAREIIRSEKYLRQLKNQQYPELANSFLCWGIIQEEVGDYVHGGLSAIHAAWICDDTESTCAPLCRNRAIELLQSAKTKGDSFAQDRGAEEAILADLFRRSGLCDKVKPVCEVGMSKNPIEVITHVLVYQMALASKQDKGCRTISDAIEYAKTS
jgi:hypothetical protein